MNDFISIVMATYKQARWLRTSLLSCLNQTYDNYEIVIVPVKGDKETWEELGRLWTALNSTGKSVRVVSSEVADYVHQRNLGIKNAKGEWITLFDSDDVMLPQKLQRELEVAKKENALIVTSGFFITDENLNIKQLFIPPDFSRERLLRGCMITDLCMVHRSIYEEFGLFDESYGECAFYEKWLRVAEKYPDRIKVNKTPVFLYRTHPEQMHRNLDREWQLMMRKRVQKESLTRKPLEKRGERI